MGMFDMVKYECTCPSCGVMVDGFQSKDKDCILEVLEINEVDNLYSHCPNCCLWIELTRESGNVFDFIVCDSYHEIIEKYSKRIDMSVLK